jgi:periplasmic protein TonB
MLARRRPVAEPSAIRSGPARRDVSRVAARLGLPETTVASEQANAAMAQAWPPNEASPSAAVACLDPGDVAAIERHIPVIDDRCISPSASQRSAAGISLSLCLHASVLVAALLVGSPPAQFERGGEVVIPVELLVVGPVEQAAATAAPETAAAPVLSLPEFARVAAPPPEPALQPPPTEIVAPQEEAPPPAIAEPTEQRVLEMPALPPDPAPQPVMEAWTSPLPVEILPEPSPPAPAPRPSQPPAQMAALPVSLPVIRREPPRTAAERKEPSRTTPVARPVRQTAARPERQTRPATATANTASRPDTGRAVASQPSQQRGGSGGAASSAGTAEIASYRSRVLAHLARFKQYPDWARDQGVTGRASVAFSITRNGQVTAVSLAGSSGSSLLDQATLAMVRRAAPFPAMPDGGPNTMSFNAGIRYDLR